MEHFVVIHDWSNEYEYDVTILGVYHSLGEAKEMFNSCVADEKNYAEENGFAVYEDSDVCFDAGKEGYYAREHTNLYIQMV